MEIQEARKARIDSSYEELKAIDYDAFRRCVETASVLQFNHGLTLTQSEAVEAALIELVLDTKRRCNTNVGIFRLEGE